MCSSGGSGVSAAQQQANTNAQLLLSAAQAQAQLAEQQKEFAITTQQNQQTIDNTKAQEDAQQQQADQEAQVATNYATTRANEQTQATNEVNQAFAQFTPDYYKQYTQDYVDHYTPQVNQQFGAASNQTTYGLARSGNLQSQTAADQFGVLNDEKGQALDDINNQAIGATTQLQDNVLNAKSNLMGAATSDTTLGSPIAPTTADAATSQFNATAQALQNLQTTAGDTTTTLSATPVYSSLGTLFSGAASGVTSAVQGANTAAYGASFNAGLGGAANPTSASSGQVIG
jgi:hypothetical protein